MEQAMWWLVFASEFLDVFGGVALPLGTIALLAGGACVLSPAGAPIEKRHASALATAGAMILCFGIAAVTPGMVLRAIEAADKYAESREAK